MLWIAAARGCSGQLKRHWLSFNKEAEFEAKFEEEEDSAEVEAEPEMEEQIFF
jgi:hypothetical protein